MGTPGAAATSSVWEHLKAQLEQARAVAASAQARAQASEERARKAEVHAQAAETALAALAASHGGHDGTGMPDVWPVALRSCHDTVTLPGGRVAILKQSREPADPAAEWRMLMNALEKGRRSR